jgi:hypothetical protein
MNRIDDFDQTLSAWLHSEAPAQAPDRVLDAALGRVAAQHQQRGWVQRFIGGTRMPMLMRAAAVAAVVVIAVFVGYELSNLNASVGPSQAPSPSPTAPSASPTPLPSPTGGPTPSAGPAALALRLQILTEMGDVHVLTVLDDGRAIATRDEGATRVQRVLTAAGIQLLRDELTATGLTDKSAQYEPIPNPGVDPPGYAGGTNLEIALPGGEMVVISWYLFGDTLADYYKPQPEAEALEALAARLATLEDWLPASAWAEAEARPYAPTQYRIYIYGFRSAAPLDQFGVETATVSWPLIDGVDVYGDVVNVAAHETGDEGPTPRCRVVSVVEGTAVIEALQAAGAATSTDRMIPGTALELGYRANRRQVVINLEPILPLADTSCGREATF